MLSEADSDEAPGGIDFSAPRAKHRPFLARKALVDDALRELAPRVVGVGGSKGPAQVFLSASSGDGKRVDGLRRVLGKLLPGEISLWSDQDLKLGGSIIPEIKAGLSESFCVVALLSEHALASEYSKQEWSSAIEAGKTIIPVFLERVEPPRELADRQSVDLSDWRGGPSAEGVRRLVDDIVQAWQVQAAPAGTLLEITGEPGSGKTALLCRLLDGMEDLGRPCLHYFADGGPDTWRTPEALAASLITQLRQRMPSLRIEGPMPRHALVGDRLLGAIREQGDAFDLTVFIDAVDQVPGIAELAQSFDRALPRLPRGLNLVVTSLAEDGLGSVDERRARYVAIELDKQQESNDGLLRAVLENRSALVDDLMPPGRLSIKLLLEPGSERGLVGELRDRLQQQGYAVFESGESDWAPEARYVEGEGLTVLIVNGALLERRGEELPAFSRFAWNWIKVSLLPEGGDGPAMVNQWLGLGEATPTAATEMLEIADAPDPAGRIVDAIRGRIDATPRFDAADDYLLERCAGNVGRLKRILDWLQDQPPGPIDSGRIPPVFYRDMDKLWAEVVGPGDEQVFQGLSERLCVARQPLSLGLLLDTLPVLVTVAEGGAALNIRAAPRGDAEVLAERGVDDRLRVMLRRRAWLLVESRRAGAPIVSGWVSSESVELETGDPVASSEDLERLAATHRALAGLVASGLVAQTTGPVDGLDPDGPEQVLYATNHPGIREFFDLRGRELVEQELALAALIPEDGWSPGPVQDLAWRYAVTHSMRHHLAAGDEETALDLAFDPAYLTARVVLQGAAELGRDLERLVAALEGASDVYATDA